MKVNKENEDENLIKHVRKHDEIGSDLSQDKLLLNQMNRIPRLDFGQVIVGQTAIRSLPIENPLPFADGVLEIEPFKKPLGFAIDQTQLVIPPSTTKDLEIVWIPTTVGPVRTKIEFKLNKKFRLECIVFGKAIEAKRRRALGPVQKEKNRRTVPSRFRDPEKKGLKRPIKQVSEPTKTVDQSATIRRVVYDKNWMQKQQEGFERWINYTIQPTVDDREEKVQSKKPKLQALTSSNSTPSTTAQLRILAKTQYESSIRRKAFELYHSRAMDEVLFKLDREITQGKLLIRSDRPLEKDYGLRELLFEILFCFERRWLSLGLQVVCNLVLSFSPTEKQLKKCIVENVILNHQIDYRTMPASKASASTLVRQASLSKFLMLIYFLDQAKQSHLLPRASNACLFRPSAPVKSTCEILTWFCKEFLTAERNIMRHLKSLDYEVSYKQTALDEYNLTVSNMAVDLRDGVRLVKLVEYLLHREYQQNKSLHASSLPDEISTALRTPVVSRLQKVYNVDLALKELRRQKINLQPSHFTTSISAKDIVDGNCEKTLYVIWQLIQRFDFERLVNLKQLQNEIRLIMNRMSSSTEAFYRQQQKEIPLSNASSDSNSTRVQLLLEWVRAIAAHYRIPVANLSASLADGRVLCYLIHYYHPQLLKKHEISSTSSKFAAQPNDAGSSFTVTSAPVEITSEQYQEARVHERANFRLVNAKAQDLGCIPVLLPPFDTLNLPEPNVMMTFLVYLQARLIESNQEIRSVLRIQSWWRRRYFKLIQARHHQAAIAIQRAWCNASQWRLALRRCRRILSAAKLIKSTIVARSTRQTFLRQRQACVLIQSTYRRHHEHRITAIIQIQCAVRTAIAWKEFKAHYMNYLIRRQCAQTKIHHWILRIHREFKHKRQASVACIEKAYRCYAWKKKLRLRRQQQMIEDAERHAASVVIQSHYKKWCVRHQYKELRRNVVRMQAYVRRNSVRRGYLQLRWVRHERAILIQSAGRQFLANRRYKAQKKAIVQIQSHMRRLYCQQQFQQQREAAIQLQHWMRDCLYRWKQTKVSHHAALKLQTAYRRHRARQQYLCTIAGIMKFQALWAVFSERVHAARTLQSIVRMHQAKQIYLTLKGSAIRVQAAWRGFFAREQYSFALDAVHMIQQTYRQYIVRKRIQQELDNHRRKLTAAAIILQKYTRKHIQRTRFRLMQQAAVMLKRSLQAYVRRLHFERKYRACVIIQAEVRQHQAQSRYRAHYEAILQIQAFARMVNARRAFIICRVSCISIQAYVRGYFVRRRLALLHHHQRLLRAYYLRYSLQKRYQALREAAIRLQCYFRVVKARKVYNNKLNEAIYSESVVLLQSWWRGLRVRLRGRKNRELRAIRKQLAVVNKTAAPPNQLKNRLRHAVHVLNHGKSLSMMLHASMTLEFCTTISNECCQECFRFQLHNTIVDGIQGCNRSLPYLKLLQHLLGILVNLIAFVRRAERSSALTMSASIPEKFLASPEIIEVLVDLLHMHRDHRQIFTLACNVLEFIATTMSQLPVHASVARLERLQELFSRKLQLQHQMHSATPSRAFGVDPRKFSVKEASSKTRRLLEHFRAHM